MTTCTPTHNTAEKSATAPQPRTLIAPVRQQPEVRTLATKRGPRAIDEPRFLLFVFLLHLPFLLLLAWLLSQLSSMSEPVHP
jgi:hypothetical protein